ncbi:uncharacterized protein [Primulina huaijiensis]|uniref:uncharacterized protein n=1 Tax=Primulina huaijiensis TaxID=1492673 RepID=UPI003CC78DD6
MGRGRGKGKKQSVFATTDDNKSGEDEKLAMRRRGRQQIQVNDSVQEEDEFGKIEEDAKRLVFNKLAKHQDATENGKKRKRPSQVKDIMEPFKEENCNGTETNGTDSIKSVGYRPIGSRRKNKPRRAAEVGVECL